eukprot:1161220-Pelagomonas_calceolata.AAC.19
MPTCQVTLRCRNYVTLNGKAKLEIGSNPSIQFKCYSSFISEVRSGRFWTEFSEPVPTGSFVTSEVFLLED